MRGLGILAAGAAVLVSVLGGRAAAESVTVENPLTYSEFKLAPKALPKRTAAAAGLVFETSPPTTAASGAPLPAVREIALRLDRHIVFDLKGFPSCKKANLEGNDVNSARRLCGSAIIGEGSAGFDSSSVLQRPVILPGALTLVLNGGRRGDVRTLYLATYVRAPVVATVLMPVKVRSVDDGRYGLEATISIPADTTETVGQLSRLVFTIAQRYTQNKRTSPVSAKCPDGKLLLSATLRFAGGAQREESHVKPCTGKG